MAFTLPTTSNDLTRMRLWGPLYLANVEMVDSTGKKFPSTIQPSDIEAILERSASDFDRINQAVGAERQIEAERNAQIVSTVFQATSAVASAIPVVGSIVSLALNIIGMFAGSAYDQGPCDSPDGLPQGSTHYYKEENHRRAIAGLNPPQDATHITDGMYYRMGIAGWSSSDSSPDARWASLANYTNDGAWYYRNASGTIIGVTGRDQNGLWVHHLADMHVVKPASMRGSAADARARKRIWEDGSLPSFQQSIGTKFDSRDPVVKACDADAEYARRQHSITLYLQWMQNNMAYSLLSCMDNAIITEASSSDPAMRNYVITNDPSVATTGKEASGCQHLSWGAWGNPKSIRWVIKDSQGYVREPVSGNPAGSLLASKYFASWMAMGDAIIQMSKALGSDKAARLIRELSSWRDLGAKTQGGVMREKCVEGFLGKAMNGCTARDVAAVPWYPGIKFLRWDQLKELIGVMANEHRIAIMQGRTVPQQRAVAATRRRGSVATAEERRRAFRSAGVDSRRQITRAGVTTKQIAIGAGALGLATVAGILYFTGRR